MDWTTRYEDPAELRAAFPQRPDARYRPLPQWWWSGETLEEERLLWQVDQLAAIGCGGFTVTGLALYGPSVGSRPDDPPGYSDEWLALYRTVADRAREHGMGLLAWSFLQSGYAIDTERQLYADPSRRGEQVRPGPDGEPRVEPYGFDFGNAEAVDALLEPGTVIRRYLDTLDAVPDDTLVGLFEDEWAAFPRWAPGFADEFRRLKGYDPDLRAFFTDIGPRTPAVRCDLFDVAARRVEGGYTRVMREWLEKHRILGGYDQMNRRGTPLVTTTFYFDPFRTMAWANAPGTDHMGDVRFHASVGRVTGASRVWLEGFHSHGWGMTLEHQLRLLWEWAREGASLYLPHGVYYANRALWWEWASPEQGFKQPYARHHSAYADAVGRLMSVAAAGEHHPEIAVLYPVSTCQAGTTGVLQWDDDALRADRLWVQLFGVHDTPSAWEPERASAPSLLAVAGYDRIAVDESRVDFFGDIPIVVGGCRTLPTTTMQALVDGAERGRTVVVVEPVPEWSSEVGREDPAFAALRDRLVRAATVVADAGDVVGALPPPRVEGNQSQWRKVGDLDLLIVAGGRPVRIRGMSGRRVEQWDIHTGDVSVLEVTDDGHGLVVDVPAPAAVLALVDCADQTVSPPGHGDGSTDAPTVGGRVIDLPATWECEYLPWGENRWGDYRLPANPGTPPVERRTFAFREGDDPAWQHAPVVPEDVDFPTVDLGFEERMHGATGRPRPEERQLGDGWREIVSTYGPKATVDGELVEYSERLGIEDGPPDAPFGGRGFVGKAKVDLGPGGRGTVSSWGLVEQACSTHLVIDGSAVVTVRLDGRELVGPVDAGVVCVPVDLDAGWHHVEIDVQPRDVLPAFYSGFRGPPRAKVSWAFTEAYGRAPVGVWGGQVFHPDYKGSPRPRQFRRRIVLPAPATVRIDAVATGGATVRTPASLPAGEHWLEIDAGAALGAAGMNAVVSIDLPDGVTVALATDEFWETRAEGEEWHGIIEPGHGAFTVAVDEGLPVERRHPLLDVAWLEGDSVLAGHVDSAWADSPDAPPPAWFSFTAPPGARRMSMPVVGDVSAWVDGSPVALDGDGWLPLREHARVAFRVQPPAGWRGGGCFREHPVFDLGEGTIEVGRSWHKQGLDVFSGVVSHRCTVDVADGDAGPALLDLGSVIGSVGVRVNGDDAGVVFCAPWTVPVELRAGTNVIELEVANTLGPMAARGVPTPYGPEDQRTSGILGRPHIVVGRRD